MLTAEIKKMFLVKWQVGVFGLLKWQAAPSELLTLLSLETASTAW